VVQLRSLVGWGAVFKMMMYAAATGQEISEIDAFSGDEGYAFGELFKDLEFEGELTNFGQLQKAYRLQLDDGAAAPGDDEAKVPPGHEKKPHKTPPGHEKKPHKTPPGQSK
jgi:hypothetical protein